MEREEFKPEHYKKRRIRKPGMRQINIEVSEELYQRFNRCFEWGEKNRTLVKVLEWLCDKVERKGIHALLYLLRESNIDSLAKLEDGEKHGDA